MNQETIALPEYYKGLELGGNGWEQIPLKKNISPRVYFNFAQADLQEKSTSRSRVNALSNAKRALHYQVDIISNALGIEHLGTKKRLDFPQKLDFCKDCGVSSPRIIRRLNKLRNVVEHDYLIPTVTQVQDYLDIVELFLAATDRIVFQFPTDIEFIFQKKVRKNLPEISYVMFPMGKGMIYLHCHPGHIEEIKEMDFFEWMKKHSIKVPVSAGETYYKWVQFLLTYPFKITA
jgi:hypothetical protein